MNNTSKQVADGIFMGFLKIACLIVIFVVGFMISGPILPAAAVIGLIAGYYGKKRMEKPKYDYSWKPPCDIREDKK